MIFIDYDFLQSELIHKTLVGESWCPSERVYWIKLPVSQVRLIIFYSCSRSEQILSALLQLLYINDLYYNTMLEIKIN